MQEKWLIRGGVQNELLAPFFSNLFIDWQAWIISWIFLQFLCLLCMGKKWKLLLICICLLIRNYETAITYIYESYAAITSPMKTITGLLKK